MSKEGLKAKPPLFSNPRKKESHYSPERIVKQIPIEKQKSAKEDDSATLLQTNLIARKMKSEVKPPEINVS